MIELLRQHKELYDLFTKKEEYNSYNSSLILDRHHRFCHGLSKHGNILEPEVSKFLIKNGLNVSYPEDKKFAVCLTHDIDFVYPSIRNGFSHVINGNIKDGLKEILSNKLNKKQNCCWNVDKIIAIENKYEARSSFYFLATDNDYNIENLKNVINNIADSGWEVGLHGGYEAYNNLDEIKKQKYKLENVLGRKVIGYRNHYLRLAIPDTWELLNKAGLKYDSTFGYADCVGFRNGMCHPFKPFNLEKNEEIDIFEIPLIIMDRTLLKNMDLEEKVAWEVTMRLIETVEKYNGVITILWHNTTNLKFYEKILMYCYEKDAWMTSGEEIFNLYNNQ